MSTIYSNRSIEMTPAPNRSDIVDRTSLGTPLINRRVSHTDCKPESIDEGVDTVLGTFTEPQVI